jgi:hypothetical protein
MSSAAYMSNIRRSLNRLSSGEADIPDGQGRRLRSKMLTILLCRGEQLCV